MKIITLLILLSFIACENSNSSSSMDERSRDAILNDTLTTKFMELVNEHRKSLGLHALIIVDEISEIAFEHSNDMANKTVTFGHEGFSARCSESRIYIRANLCAENVAMGQKTAEAVFTSWMNSPSHRGNIESVRLTHVGLGVAFSESGTHFWTHLFLEKK